MAADVLARGQRMGRGGGQRRPVFDGAVATQGLLDPEQRPAAQLFNARQRLPARPGLVDVHRQFFARQQGGEGFFQIGGIALLGKTYLDLETAVAFGTGAPDGPGDVGMVDAAGVDGHGAVTTAAQETVQGQTRAAGRQIPQGYVQGRQRLGHGAGFIGLQAQDFQLTGDLRGQGGRAAPGLAYDLGEDGRLQQPCPVFGTAGGKVAPGFAPAVHAVFILQAQQDSRPVVHDAERGTNRFFDGRPENEDLRGAHRGRYQICRHGLPPC